MRALFAQAGGSKSTLAAQCIRGSGPALRTFSSSSVVALNRATLAADSLSERPLRHAHTRRSHGRVSSPSFGYSKGISTTSVVSHADADTASGLQVSEAGPAPAPGPYDILFCGSDEFALEHLQYLWTHGRHLIKSLTVLVPPDLPPRRRENRNMQASLTKRFAEERSIRTVELPKDRKIPSTRPSSENQAGEGSWSLPPVFSKPSSSLLLLTASFGQIIPEWMLDLFTSNSASTALNAHPSLLPKLRGAAPIQWAIARGHEETGVSIQQLSRKHFDCGRLLGQETARIPDGSDLVSLKAQLGTQSASLMLKVLEDLPNAHNQSWPQDEAQMTRAPKITLQDRYIDWENMTADEIALKSRAFGRQDPLFSYIHQTDRLRKKTIFQEQRSRIHFSDISVPEVPLHQLSYKISTKLAGKSTPPGWAVVRDIAPKDGITGPKDKETILAIKTARPPSERDEFVIDFKEDMLQYLPSVAQLFSSHGLHDLASRPKITKIGRSPALVVDETRPCKVNYAKLPEQKQQLTMGELLDLLPGPRECSDMPRSVKRLKGLLNDQQNARMVDSPGVIVRSVQTAGVEEDTFREWYDSYETNLTKKDCLIFGPPTTFEDELRRKSENIANHQEVMQKTIVTAQRKAYKRREPAILRKAWLLAQLRESQSYTGVPDIDENRIKHLYEAVTFYVKEATHDGYQYRPPKFGSSDASLSERQKSDLLDLVMKVGHVKPHDRIGNRLRGRIPRYLPHTASHSPHDTAASLRHTRPDKAMTRRTTPQRRSLNGRWSMPNTDRMSSTAHQGFAQVRHNSTLTSTPISTASMTPSTGPPRPPRRPRGTLSKLLSEDKTWSELHPAQKVARTGYKTGQITIVVIGSAVAIAALWALLSDMFAPNSPSVIYKDACSRIEQNEEIYKHLLSPLRFHVHPYSGSTASFSPLNPPSNMDRRRRGGHVPHVTQIQEPGGRTILAMRFWIEARDKERDWTYMEKARESVKDGLGWCRARIAEVVENLREEREGQEGEGRSPSSSATASSTQKQAKSSEPGYFSRFLSTLSPLPSSGGPSLGRQREPGTFASGEVHAELYMDAYDAESGKGTGKWQYRKMWIDVPKSGAMGATRVWVVRKEGEAMR